MKPAEQKRQTSKLVVWYSAVGCNPATQAFDPSCNIRAARHLFDQNGTAPWRV